MGYGLQFTGGANNTIIDSDTGYDGLVKVSTGTVSAGSTVSVSANQYLWVRPSATSGTATIYNSQFNTSSRNFKASVACAYILTERGNTAANNVSSDGSTYGLKIFDTNGTTVILNSQRTNGVMNIVAGIPSGNAATAGGSTLFTKPSGSNLNSYYVGILGLNAYQFEVEIGTGTGTTTTYFGSYKGVKYDYTNGVIKSYSATSQSTSQTPTSNQFSENTQYQFADICIAFFQGD